MEVLAFISFFLGASWDFFTEIKVPGFDFSFAALFCGPVPGKPGTSLPGDDAQYHG